MKYTVEDLIKEKKDWSKDDFIFFWKIRKGKEINKSCLSQWYPSEFIVKGRRYSCAEQYMMAQKALLFEDEESYKKIIASSEPKEIKTLGGKVKGFDPVKWDEEKYRIVREGNFAKFTQKQELRGYLVSTECKILVEVSPYDNVWGIGINESNPDILDPSKWKGQNLLDFILMDIRDEIIERIPEPELFEWEEEFTDDETGETIKINRQNRNEKYLPEAQKIWDQMIIDEDKIIKKEKDNQKNQNKLTILSDLLKNMVPDERDPVLLGYKYNIDDSWFIEEPKGSGHHFDLPTYIADVVPEKQMLYVKYLSELFDIFDKHDLNEENAYLGWYVIHPNSPYLWDFFDGVRRNELIGYYSKIDEEDVDNLLENLFSGE